MNTNEIARQVGVTPHRLGVISRQLWGEVPAEFTGDHVAQAQSVADYMRENGLRSVKQAIADMSTDTAQETANTGDRTPSSNDMHAQMGQVIEEASDQYADYMTAGILDSTMRKVGRLSGPRTAAVLENFTQALIPSTELTPNGLTLNGSTAQSTLLLSGSQSE